MAGHAAIPDRMAVRMLERALRLYTPSLAERPMAEFLAERCEDLGFEQVRIDDVGNLRASRGSGRPRVLLCGHMDTVPGKIRVRREGDRLYGRGASDAKAPLVAMMLAAASAEGCGTVSFVGAVDEEGNAAGIKHLVRRKLDVDYAVFGEPSGLLRVTIGYKGRLAIRLRVRAGDSSHASAPWLSRNAIREAADLTAAIGAELEGGQEGLTPAARVTAAVTEISGGTSHNVTPSECEATMDIRMPAGASCKGIEERIAALVGRVSAERGVEAIYSIIDETEPFEAPADSPLVRAFGLGLMESEGRRPMLIRKTGTGDMNVLGNRLGIPVVTYGPGDPHASHTAGESVSVSEYLRAIGALRSVLSHLKRLHDKRAARAAGGGAA